jgi:hypothetical protein
MKFEFSPRVFGRNLKYQISSKSVQWEPNCSMRTDVRTHMTKLLTAFRNFANAPKKGVCHSPDTKYPGNKAAWFLSMEQASCHHSGSQNFQMDPIFLKYVHPSNLCANTWAAGKTKTKKKTHNTREITTVQKGATFLPHELQDKERATPKTEHFNLRNAARCSEFSHLIPWCRKQNRSPELWAFRIGAEGRPTDIPSLLPNTKHLSLLLHAQCKIFIKKYVHQVAIHCPRTSAHSTTSNVTWHQPKKAPTTRFTLEAGNYVDQKTHYPVNNKSLHT